VGWPASPPISPPFQALCKARHRHATGACALPRWCRRLTAVAWLGLALAASPALAAKTDVVVLRNGDRLTGEVQQLERGRLRLKTDDVGTVEIEWDEIVSITADAPLDLDDVRGNRYVGSLAPGPPGQLRLSWGDAEQTVEILSIVRIRRLYTSFWSRLNGSIDAGASYTSASELFTLDLSGTIGVERPGFGIDVDAAATVNTQPDVEDTRRASLSFAYERRFTNRWVALVQGQLEQNRELGFDLRSSASAGGGRLAVLDQRNRLLTGIGLSLNRERPTEGETTTNVEAVAVVRYDRFSYDFPKVDVAVTATGFASLTDGGRYRFELDAQFKRELVRDFYATLRGYESYDSRPATEGAQKNDYGVTFALGWSF
jgi:hypothetical protein